MFGIILDLNIVTHLYRILVAVYSALYQWINNNNLHINLLQVFREHSIDGSALVVLSETHMTRILGMKLGPAFRLRAAINELMNRTTSPSFCITN